MRVVFVGGGTSGHVNPALSIADYVKKREPDAEILYIGAKGGIEERLVPKAGYPIETISISGFQRKLSVQNIFRNVKTVGNIFLSTMETKKILKRFRPDVCVGTGGYVSGPVLREAAKLRIPTVAHESNAIPGKTTKWLSKTVDTVLLAVPETKKYFDEKAHCVVTGNPVREEFTSVDPSEARRKLGLDGRPVILSFGGSLGATAINSAVIGMLRESVKEGRFQHIHGYGTHDEDFLNRLHAAGIQEKEHPEIRLFSYIDEMPTILAAADLVISRAGAMTLSEITAAGKASILIPSPNVAENHQFHNADNLVQKHAAMMLEEKDLTGERLWQMARNLAGRPQELRLLGEQAKKIQDIDAKAQIYREIKRTVKA